MNVWDRREGETAKAYSAFITYRDLGAERSLSKVSKALGKSTALLCRWSSANDWTARAEAWDANQQLSDDDRRARLRDELIEDEIADYRAQLLQWRKTWDIATRTPDPDFQNLTKWRRDISAMGRLALGLPDKVTESQLTGAGGGDLQFVINVKTPEYDDIDGDPDDDSDPEL